MKNYTSTVPVERTIARIEQILMKAGARNIIKDYDGGGLLALSFTLFYDKDRRLIPIRLPANVNAVEKVLLSLTINQPGEERRRRIREQAARTAWKLTQDWVEVQVSLIEIQQVEALQVFLPYIWDGKKTLYAAMKESGFKLLPAALGRE